MLLWTLAAAALLAATPTEAGAFSVLGKVFDFQGEMDLAETLRTTDRWSVDAGGGLHDGVIEVAIDPALAASLGVEDPEERARVEQAVVDGVLRWRSPVLAFDIKWAAPDGSHEIEITTAPDAEVRALGGGQGGIAIVHSEWSEERLLSNGASIPGWSITSVEIVFNATTLTQLFDIGLPIHVAVKPLLRLTTHEVGHGLGFAHPTDDPAWNIDSDDDPYNPLVVDPAAPFEGLVVSPYVDDTAIMVPASDLPTVLLAFETALVPDDRAVRDVLYPEWANAAPVCSDAVASPALLWPPDRKMVPVAIEGISDPDGDPVQVHATLVTQDDGEAGSPPEAGPDSQLAPLALRAQRSGRGPGRIYQVSFSAEDGNGGSCRGLVRVCVPHDASSHGCGRDGVRR